MLLVICHNNGDRNPPLEALKEFPPGVKFYHFHSHAKQDGYMYWAQLHVLGLENLAVDRADGLQWVEFDGYKIGG